MKTTTASEKRKPGKAARDAEALRVRESELVSALGIGAGVLDDLFLDTGLAFGGRFGGECSVCRAEDILYKEDFGFWGFWRNRWAMALTDFTEAYMAMEALRACGGKDVPEFTEATLRVYMENRLTGDQETWGRWTARMERRFGDVGF
ncbi:hypothetical protein FUAX_33210 [Fulvitalea axinellae]|uniref:Uncharacterized protein n=1 Tax=Fulvitalea axinellae TaxID=1182444 RepID=A0AAU9CFD9_9BACT|nr:hypothetical protein FUAX_33210 [Fulvitalea axinellae]